jgi:hypothetical protein
MLPIALVAIAASVHQVLGIASAVAYFVYLIIMAARTNPESMPDRQPPDYPGSG